MSELPEFHDQTHRIARKQHRCCECRGSIEPGDVYERFAGKWAGDFREFKTCLMCEQARDFYMEVLESPEFRDPQEGAFTFTMLREELHEAARECDGLAPGEKFCAGRHIVGMDRRRQDANSM